MTVESEKELKSFWAGALGEIARTKSLTDDTLLLAVTRFVQRGALLDGALIWRWNRSARESGTAVPVDLLLRVLGASDRVAARSQEVRERQRWVLELVRERLQAALPEAQYGSADDEACLVLSEVMLRVGASRAEWSLLACSRLLARADGRSSRWWLGRDAFELAHDRARKQRADRELAEKFIRSGRRSERCRWRLAASFALTSYYSWFEKV
jgi:hypothetical protein